MTKANTFRISKLILLFLTLFITASCERAHNRSRKIIPVLKSNSPVNYGDTIRVFVANEVVERQRYIITAPPGQSGIYGTTLIEDNARSKNEGLYYVTASLDGGEIVGRDSVIVEVIPAPIPCQPDINTAKSSSLGINMTFTTVESKIERKDWRKITASSPEGYISFLFKGKTDPDKDRTYVTTFENGVNGSDAVYVKLWQKGSSGLSGASDQLLHVTKENGKIYFTLCDFQMGSTRINARVELN